MHVQFITCLDSIFAANVLLCVNGYHVLPMYGVVTHTACDRTFLQ